MVGLRSGVVRLFERNGCGDIGIARPVMIIRIVTGILYYASVKLYW